MTKKAISPLVAAILLITFSMGISVVVMNWVAPIANTNIEKTGHMDDTRNICSTARAEIISVGINLGNSASINIQNTGDVSINLTEAFIYNKNYDSCKLVFDKSVLDIGDFSSTKNNTCNIFNICNDFLLVDVVSACKNIIIRFNNNLENTTNGCRSS